MDEPKYIKCEECGNDVFNFLGDTIIQGYGKYRVYRCWKCFNTIRVLHKAIGLNKTKISIDEHFDNDYTINRLNVFGEFRIKEIDSEVK